MTQKIVRRRHVQHNTEESPQPTSAHILLGLFSKIVYFWFTRINHSIAWLVGKTNDDE